MSRLLNKKVQIGRTLTVVSFDILGQPTYSGVEAVFALDDGENLPGVLDDVLKILQVDLAGTKFANAATPNPNFAVQGYPGADTYTIALLTAAAADPSTTAWASKRGPVLTPNLSLTAIPPLNLAVVPVPTGV